MDITKIEFEKKREQLFLPMIEKYKFIYCVINNDVLLLGEKYAILFFQDGWNIDVSYLNFEENKIWEYPINNFICANITNKDRNNIKWNKNFYHDLLADTKVLINTLENNWEDLLEGGLSWLKAYRSSKDGYKPNLINPLLEEKIKEVINNN